MNKKTEPVAEAVVTVIMRQLTEAAATLNNVSDALGEEIARIDTSLKALNLGLACWIPVTKGGDWNRDFGYAKVNNIWGVALKSSRGSRDTGTYEEQLYRFNEAPRYMRVETAGKIPQLLEALLVRAQEATEQVRTGVRKVSMVADAMDGQG